MVSRQAWVLSLHGFQSKTGKEKNAITLPSLFLAAHCGKCCDSSGKVLTAHVQECAGRVWPALAAQVESQLPYWMIFSRGIKDHRGQADVGLKGGMEAGSRQREPCYHQLWAIEIFSARMNWPGSHFRRTPLQCGGGGGLEGDHGHKYEDQSATVGVIQRQWGTNVEERVWCGKEVDGFKWCWKGYCTGLDDWVVRRKRKGTQTRSLAWPPGSRVMLSGDGEHKVGKLWQRRREKALSSAWGTFTWTSCSGEAQ